MSEISKKVLILKGDSYKAVGTIFTERGYDVIYDDKMLSQADLVVFTGGSDVSPYIYGEEPDGARGCDPQRDEYEKEIFQYCQSFESKLVPMVGICRGGQLLNVLNGGKMVQHLGKTISGDIEMDVYDGRSMIVRVDHHQGILARENVSVDAQAWLLHEQDGIVVDYAIWYPETKSLCFQPHPEWGHEGTKEYFFDLIDRYIEIKDSRNVE